MSFKNFLDSIQGISIDEHVSFSQLTTFQLGGPCRGLVCCQNPYQFKSVVQSLSKHHEPLIVIGEGSNLLVSDQGLDCVVVKYFNETHAIGEQGNTISVCAGMLLDQVCLWAAQNNKTGLNFMSGIPGTVGGAVAGNAGAFGRQISDIVKSVSVLNPNGEIVEHDPQALGFRYRHSRFKETEEMIIEVKLWVDSGERAALLKEREEILLKRYQKHPDYKNIPCAGSFFRNIEASSCEEPRQAAGWFLEQVGAKQMSVGGAGVFEKHANIIIKRSDSCTAQDVYLLSQKMQDAVKERFGICLEPEVRLIGFFED